jgi:hypothetical protein
MFACLVEPKPSISKKLIIVLTVGMIWLSIIGKVVHPGLLPAHIADNTQKGVTLLLNSGSVNSKKAEVRVIVWLKDGTIPEELKVKKPLPGWVWNYRELQTESGKTAATLSGQCNLDKNEERKLFTWYTDIAQRLSTTGSQVYLDERVPQTIDISAYLSQINAQPAQWDLTGSLLSIAAFQANLNTKVMAGKDRVNIQLVSRGKNPAGHTVLAIPALLEEF